MSKRETRSGLERWGKRARRCLPVEVVQKVLDPLPGELPILPLGQNQWRQDAYENLVKVACDMPKNPHMLPSICDRVVKFSLGLESERPPENQIIAGVSRAFALTDSYADACADERDRVIAIHNSREIVEQAMRGLTENSPLLCKRGSQAFAWEQEGPIAELLDALAGMNIPSTHIGFERVEDMRKSIADGLANLRCLLDLSEDRSSFAPEKADHDQFRRFFVICLTEIFAAHGDRLPYFDAHRRVKSPYWVDFLNAALETVGFMTQGLDDMLRDLRRGQTKREKTEDWEETLEYELRELRNILTGNVGISGHLLGGEYLPSTGWMLDVSAQQRPASFEMAYPHLVFGDALKKFSTD